MFKNLSLKQFGSVLLLMFFAINAKSQFTATWALTTNKTVVVAGAQAANITAGNMVPASNLSNPGTHTTSGYEVKPLAGYLANSGNNYWYTSFNDSTAVSLPLSPNAGFDMILDTFSVTTKRSNSSGENTAMLSYRANGNGAWNYIGTSKVITTSSSNTVTKFTGLNTIFYAGNSYVVRVHFAAEQALTTRDNRVLSIKTLIISGRTVAPPFIAPTATTGVVGTATKYNNTVTSSSYTITNAGINIRPVLKSGVCYGTMALPKVTDAATVDVATNGVGSASFNSAINGLTPNTTYNVRAYAMTQVDTVYGAVASFTTLPFTVPTVTTTAPTNILSSKVTTGGSNIDSGGYGVLEKGILYSTLNSNLVYPATGQTKATSDGIGNANYTTLIKNLLPNTKYYIKAFARNSLGAGYGNVDSFTTAAPVPVITVTPSNLDFGDITYNTTPTVLSYKVNASYLSPAAGNITLYSSNGYTMCATLNGVYNDTLPISYTSSAIANKTIYVKGSSTPYGILSGRILHTGGGTVVPNADTTFLTTNVVQNQDTLTNKGTDFWCGFGYQESMRRKSTDGSMPKLSIYVAATDQDANVTVEAPGAGYATQTVLIPAGTVKEFTNFPVGEDVSPNINASGLPDTRLYATGVSNKGIHIKSNNGVPVAAWMHTYSTNNSGAGSMLFPTNTWNSSYTVQTFGGKSNNGYIGNTYFFVIANEDNTTIQFAPTCNVLDSIAGTTLFTDNNNTPVTNIKYASGVTSYVTLNKGQVFNAMAAIDQTTDIGSSGLGALDLTGTVVKSTDCSKKISVFAGNGRLMLKTVSCNSVDGSDHLVQQMFPKVAWGTKYLTAPTKNMEYNLYRVLVDDPATNIWINIPGKVGDPNHTATTALSKTTTAISSWNSTGKYYYYQTAQPLKIESDQPISVTQFIASGGCALGYVGDGDPEMIILSPIQQAINKATFYSAPFKKGSSSPSVPTVSSGNCASYVNIIVKKEGLTSLKLDNVGIVGSATDLAQIDTGFATLSSVPGAAAYKIMTKPNIKLINAFTKHIGDTSYVYAKIMVRTAAAHTVTCNESFNIIAYGTGDGESYGYNAGTTINNLSAIKFSLNPFGADTSTSSVKTGVDNLVTLQIAIPYDTTTINSIIWNAGVDATRYTPTGPQAGIINPATTKPVCSGTIIRDGRTFYIYKSPVQYKFFEEGAYKVKVSINGTFVSDCGGTDEQYINVIVGHDDISFTATPAGCGSKNVTIADATTPLAGTNIIKWIWDFGDGTKDSASIGDSWAPNPKTNPHTYPANNAYYIKLTTINSVGMYSYDSVLIDLAFGINTSFTSFRDTTCVGENVVFTPTSSTNAAKWFWDFGDASPIDSSNNTASSVSHAYTSAGTYFVSHWVKTIAGCPSAVVNDTIVVTKTPSASFISPAGVCLPGNTQFINSSDTSAAGAAIPYTYHWSFGTGNAADTSNVKNPVFAYTTNPPLGGYPVQLVATSRFGCTSTVFTQNVNNVFVKPTAAIGLASNKKVCAGSNANFFDASSGTNQTVNSWYWNFGDGGTANTANPQHIYTNNIVYTVKLAIGTDKGCVSDTAVWSIKVNPKPIAGTILPSSCITSGSLLFQDNSTVAVDDSVQTPYTYTWNFGDGSGTYTTKDSSHTYGVGTYYINHSITTLNGCTDTKTDTFTISGSKPAPNFYVINRLGLCSNIDVNLVDTSTVAVGAIKKVEIRWDVFNNYNDVQTDVTPSNGLGGSTKTYTHKYPSLPSTKTYFIRLYAYSGSTCMDSLEKSITVYGSPKVIFDTISGVCLDGAPKKINLAIDSSGRFNSAVFATWKYSGPSVLNDTFYPATAGAGTHLIKAVFVTKIPFIGCRDSAYAPITVWALPTVKFDTAIIKCEGNSILFNDQSTAGTGSGNINKWLWNFGNPASGTSDTSSKNNPSHTYSNYGTYNVTLRVTSDSGCTATLTPPKAITINPKPKVGFISPAGTCAGTPVGFTDTSKIADGTQSLFTHSWNFGDPASGALNIAIGTPLPNPSHLYNNTPPDSVKLIVTSNNSCVDSFAVKLSSTIFPIQTPIYIANGVLRDTNEVIRVCLGKDIKFSSGLAANNFYWIFGDSVGVINNTASPSHTYPSATTFKGSFYVDDKNGCRSKTVPINVQILPLPIVAIEVANPTCEKNIVTFTDKSVAGVGTGNIKSVIWNFGDPASGALNTSTAMPKATHTYSSANVFNVALTATSDSGCAATIATPLAVTIHPLPKVDFSLPTSVCLESEVASFTDLSTIADGSEAQFKHTWNFGDLASADNIATGNPLKTATHNYSTSANYYIKLFVETKDGCKDSSLPKLLAASVLHSKSKAYYTVNAADKDNPKVCLGTPITFKDSSGTGITKSYWIWGDEGLTTYLGVTPPPHLYTPAGSYYGVHFVDDKFGCRSDTNDFIVTIDSFPVAIGGEKYILQGSSAILTPYISGADTYLWTVINPIGSTNDYLDFDDVENPLCTPILDSVIYRIDAATSGGCTAPPAYYTVKLLHTPVIPNVFSPNGDGVNDYWDITSLQYFTGSSVQVFNRYGQQVLNRFGYLKPWDGNDAIGKPLPVGVYYYIIKPGLGLQAMTGTITIIR